MESLWIQNGNVVLPDRVVKASLLIQEGKIAGIFEGTPAPEGCTIVDAEGKMVLPGLIDTHVHMTDPGPFNYREDWAHGSRCAASGGITTIADMPLPSTAVLGKEGFEAKYNTANEHSVVDFALWGGINPKNLDKLPELNGLGCVGYKGFMCFATEEYPQITDGYLVEGMKLVKEFDGLIGVHAENAEVAAMGCDRFSQMGCQDEAMFDEARPWWTEYEAIQRAVLFSKVTGARLEVCHTTIPQGMQFLKQAKSEGVHVYVESCPHYLIFDKTILREKKSFAKCTPPFRSREYVDKLWDYVLDGTVDVLGSDHGPFTDEEKVQQGDFWKEFCGFGCFDATLAAMITEGVHKRGMSWCRLAELMSTNAAKMFQLYPRKGNLLPGADADIVLVDPNVQWVYDGAKSFSKTKSTKGVYQGMNFQGKVAATYVRGQLVYNGTEIVVPDGYGEFVRRR